MCDLPFQDTRFIQEQEQRLAAFFEVCKKELKKRFSPPWNFEFYRFLRYYEYNKIDTFQLTTLHRFPQVYCSWIMLFDIILMFYFLYCQKFEKLDEKLMIWKTQVCLCLKYNTSNKVHYKIHIYMISNFDVKHIENIICLIKYTIASYKNICRATWFNAYAKKDIWVECIKRVS